MSLEDYAEKIGQDLSLRPVPLTGLDVLPDVGPVHTARPGHSIGLLPGDSVTVRPGASTFDPQKGILATRSAADGLLSQNAQRRRPGFETASDISGHMGRFIEGQRGVVQAAVDGGKELAGATDELGTARRVLGGLKGANIGLTVAGEAFGLADDLKRGVPARVAVPGAVIHGVTSGGAAALGGAAGGLLGMLLPIPVVGTALGAAAGTIAAGWAADQFGPTREHYGWEFEKIRKGR